MEDLKSLLSKIRGFNIPQNEAEVKMWFSRWDFNGFSPSYEHIVSRETKTCQRCRSVVYQQQLDVSNITLQDLIDATHPPKVEPEKTLFDEVVFKVTDKISDWFGFYSLSKLEKRVWENRIPSHFALPPPSKEKLHFPILHRCSSCRFAWPLFFEVKTWLAPTISTIFKVEQLYRGMILLKEKNEWALILTHMNALQSQLKEHGIQEMTDAKKKLQMGDIEGALELVVRYCSGIKNDFFLCPAMLLQARHSQHIHSKIRGLPSPAEERKNGHEINNDLVLLINEIEKYRNMQ